MKVTIFESCVMESVYVLEPSPSVSKIFDRQEIDKERKDASYQKC